MAFSRWNQLKLLLWKNWLLHKRQVWMSIFEVLLPVIISVILIVIRQTIKQSQDFRDPFFFLEFGIDKFPPSAPPPGTSFRDHEPNAVFYAPENNVTHAIINATKTKLNLKVKGFEDEASLLGNMSDDNYHFFSLDSNSKLRPLCGIVFDNLDDPNSTSIDYRLRFSNKPKNSGEIHQMARDKDWKTNLVYPLFQILGPRQGNGLLNKTGGDPGYYREGFLFVQWAVNQGISEYLIAESSSKSDRIGRTLLPEDVEFQLKRIPYPPYTNDIFVTAIQLQFPFIFVISFLITVLDIVKNVAVEKDKKLKESMKIMGLANWLHWTAWFVKCFINIAVVVGLITLLLTLELGPRGRVIPHSDPSCVFVFLFLYGLATINFSFMLSTFFSKANTAAVAAGVIWLITYFPNLFIQQRYDQMSFTLKIVSSLLHNINMAYGCQLMGMFEGKGSGLQWATLSQPSSVDDNFSMREVMLMFVADFFLYGLVTWYVESVAPGELGVPQKWYFPFSPRYWLGPNWNCKIKDKKNRNIWESNPELDLETGTAECNDFFERNPVGITAGIKILNLRKKFGNKVAVHGTTLDMFNEQITVLLGHNGAGKSTTMSVLTGQFPPTSGMAFVNGHDIRYELDEVRHSIGLCPQHDVLFDTLTVHEHLYFFGKLKDDSNNLSNLDENINKIISDLNLQSKRHTPSKNLSGGMKRKLSVGIALIGNPKVVMLDEPTSGMDPAARRQTWDVLLKYKQGRTMLLTTHFMDEADILGNRIAIMASGVIKCCGSSLFLKSKYGAGYHMFIVKDGSNCDVSRVSNIICHYVPLAQLESNISAELAYILPKENSSSFPELFAYLETNKTELGIASYGASITTMEEVFMRVGEEEDETLAKKLQGEQGQTLIAGIVSSGTQQSEGSQTDSVLGIHAFENLGFQSDDGKANSASPAATSSLHTPTANAVFSNNHDWLRAASNRHSGFALFIQQFYAMLLKRILNTTRNWTVTLAQLLLPMFFVSVALGVAKTMPKLGDSPPLSLNLSKFSYSYNVYKETPVPNHPWAKEVGEHYRKVIDTSKDKSILVNSTTQSLDKYLVNIAKNEGLSVLNDHYIIGAIFGGTKDKLKVVGLFNNQAYHTPAITLQYIANALLGAFDTPRIKMIKANNHPLPRTVSDKVTDQQTRDFNGFLIAFNLMFGFSFLSASFAVFLIKERVSKAKHIQIVAGVHFLNFWGSTFIWDFLSFLIISVLVVIVFLLFDIQAYTDKGNLSFVFLLLFCYAFSQLPMTYLFSFVFNVPTSGFVKVVMFNLFSGVVTLLINSITSIPQLGILDTQRTLEWIFFLFPGFALGQGMSDIYNNYMFNKTCNELPFGSTQVPFLNLSELCKVSVKFHKPFACCEDSGCGDNCLNFTSNYMRWEKPGIGREVSFLMLSGFIFFTILLLYESQILRGFFYSIRDMKCGIGSISSVWPSETSEPQLDSRLQKPKFSRFLSQDEDVKKESERFSEIDTTNLNNCDVNSIVLSSLTKYYQDFLAVDGISVAIPKAECFGLLGVNGAGKTTTFKMLTGDETITEGNAFLGGYDIRSNLRKVQQRMGYCPQFDALIDLMTGWETLVMYARLRGIPEKDIPAMVKNIVSALLLDEHIHKFTKAYSGGNKRKLSTAIALVGNPEVVLLDEPTTGMDPVARRLLWDTLSSVRETGKQSIILTSHSMEECEALCTRLAIMVNGKFKCLGSCQHLKTKFGNGYTVMARLGIDSDPMSVFNEMSLSVSTFNQQVGMQALIDFMNKSFPGAELKDEHQGLVHYWIPQKLPTDESASITWAEIFDTMEKNKERLKIEDYSVSQTTLEQVFLNFAKSQNVENRKEPIQ